MGVKAASPQTSINHMKTHHHRESENINKFILNEIMMISGTKNGHGIWAQESKTFGKKIVN